MRLRPFFTTLGLLAAAACASPDNGSIIEQSQGSARTGDFDGIPDLIVDVHTLATSWVVYDHELKEGACSLREENLTPGKYRLLRFTVGSPNVGTADLYIGDPNVHWDPNGDLDPSDSDGLFEYSTCHGHFHYRNYATYQLIAKDGTVTKARKTGFCMLDIHPFSPAHKTWGYRECGTPPDLRFGLPGHAGNQGISVGWSDEYDKWLDGQFFVLDDPSAPAVPPGDYTIRITVNPPFTAGPGESCPAVDTHGFCHGFRESNYDNNVGEIAITIPAHPGKSGFGPGSTKNPPDGDLIDDGSTATN